MTLRQMEYFLAVIEEGSFSQAASRLNVTQPALSQQVKALEEGLGAQLVEDALKLLRVGLSPAAQPQAADGVTYARKMEKAEARLDLALPAVELERAVRAFYPWPVAELQLEGERLRVHQAEVVADAPAAAPGTLLEADRRGILLATGIGGLRLLRVQREGGRPVGAADYLNARPLAVNPPRTS